MDYIKTGIFRIAVENVVTTVYNLVKAKFVKAMGQLEPHLLIQTLAFTFVYK